MPPQFDECVIRKLFGFDDIKSFQVIMQNGVLIYNGRGVSMAVNGGLPAWVAHRARTPHATTVTSDMASRGP